MSQFRIQRKFTSVSTIKPKSSLPQPTRIRSLQSKHSLSGSPKRSQSDLKQFVKKISQRKWNEEQIPSLKHKMQQGAKAYKQKNIAKAIQIFKELRKTGYKSAELSYYMGSSFLNLGKHQTSIMYLNECITINKAYNCNAYLYIAINFKLMGNLKQAVRQLDEGLKFFPNFEQGQFYKAKLLMKLGQQQRATLSFRRCLQINPSNSLAILFLGDCLKASGKIDKALQKYKLVIRNHKKFADLAAIRAASILIDSKHYKQAYCLLTEVEKLGVENSQISYYLGITCYHLYKRNESIVYLQCCLGSTKDSKLASKALRIIVKHCFQDGKFYEAQHQINRIQKLNLEVQKFQSWSLLVEGVNDLIKRKGSNACSKLQQAVKIQANFLKTQNYSKSQSAQFFKHAYIYLGYAYYSTNKIPESIQAYQRALEYNNFKDQILACKLIVEGIQFHMAHSFQIAISKFIQAFEIEEKLQTIFLVCISEVNGFKQKEELKQQAQKSLNKYFEMASYLLNQRKYHLFLFYKTLILLYFNKPSTAVIQQAIQDSQDPISQYYFIFALSLYNGGKLSEALSAITKAIDLDPGIEQFYRERSKYYFIAEDYNSAIADCYKAESLAPEDEQVPLLLSFFLYLKDQFELAHKYLDVIKPTSGKLYQFEIALCLRLGIYKKLQEIGLFLQALNQKQRINECLFQAIEKFIADRYQYSQFSVYFYHLVLGVGYCHNKNYQKGLANFFGCLEEIQLLIDQKEQKDSSYEVTCEQTEAMLDQVKFNIVIASLLKGNFAQSEHFIKTFANQTSTEQLKQALLTFLKFIQNQQSDQMIRLIVQNDTPKISDKFQQLTISLHNQKIVTKFLVSFPVKLKFSIAPEFDPAYLFNFDIDKIEYKVSPPWLKLPTKQVNFTNMIRNQSILLTETQRSSRQSQYIQKRANTVQKLRLDKQVQVRLQKLMKK